VGCNPQSGACESVNKEDGTPCGAASACAHDVCRGGECVLGVAKPKGTACNDANDCTQTDACDGTGNCVGGDPVTCPPGDACHAAAACDAATGQCGPNPILTNWCFIGGTCYQTGDADPGNPCRVCEPGQNRTAFSARANGVACDDGDQCTQDDTCQDGVCTAGRAVVCTASDQCHAAGTCDRQTGTCSNPDKIDGTACNDGNRCTTGDACRAGVCIAGTAVGCTASDQCHNAGTCDPATGACSNPPAENGRPCGAPGQTCQNGACVTPTTSLCGDGTCNESETCATCPEDCGPCPPVCGDGVCDECETCGTCPEDCGPCPTSCTTSDDCVPAQCCHPSSCTHRAHAPASTCCGACDAGCMEGTMDCGQGTCFCRDGLCVVFWPTID
jgi:hypothetical protein